MLLQCCLGFGPPHNRCLLLLKDGVVGTNPDQDYIKIVEDRVPELDFIYQRKITTNQKTMNRIVNKSVGCHCVRQEQNINQQQLNGCLLLSGYYSIITALLQDPVKWLPVKIPLLKFPFASKFDSFFYRKGFVWSGLGFLFLKTHSPSTLRPRLDPKKVSPRTLQRCGDQDHVCRDQTRQNGPRLSGAVQLK